MKIHIAFAVSLIVFVVLLFVVPEQFISAELGNTILTISTFLFGILAGFYIIVTTTDYNNVKMVAAAETAGYISLYENVALYHPPAAERLADLIDECVRCSFDYDFIEYARGTTQEFEQVRKYVLELPKNETLSSVYEQIRSVMADLILARQQLTVLGTKALSFFQWMVLFGLAVLVIGTLYSLRSGEVFFDAVTVIISSSIVLILILIRDIDQYTWNERTFGFEVFENVFLAIGKLPYYPAEALQQKLVTAHKGSYRLGTLIHPSRGYERDITTISS